MKTLLTLIASLTISITASADFQSRADLINKTYSMVFDHSPHEVIEMLRNEIGMPDLGSDDANRNRIQDYAMKQYDLNRDWKSWEEFDQYEKNGCSFSFTNQAVSATMLLQDSTNWTGIQSNGKELGYVVTNYVAQIVYEGSTNYLTVKTTTSEIAKWRELIKNQLIWNINMMPCSVITNLNCIQCN